MSTQLVEQGKIAKLQEVMQSMPAMTTDMNKFTDHFLI